MAILPDAHRAWVVANAVSAGPTLSEGVEALLRASYYMTTVDPLLYAVLDRGSHRGRISDSIESCGHPHDYVPRFDDAHDELVEMWSLYQRTARAAVLAGE